MASLNELSNVQIQQINGGYVVQSRIFHPTVTNTTTGAITPEWFDDEINYYANFVAVSAALALVLP